MRKLVVSLVVLLGASGLALVLARAMLPAAALPPLLQRILSLVHIWGGVLFLVVYPLYAWDHILANRRWLRTVRVVTATGVVQGLSAALLILSGLLVLAYGEHVWAWARTTHHWLTYPLAAALLLHRWAPKRWRPPRRDRTSAKRPTD